jgi:hypothetical protein
MAQCAAGTKVHTLHRNSSKPEIALLNAGRVVFGDVHRDHGHGFTKLVHQIHARIVQVVFARQDPAGALWKDETVR